MSSLCYCIYVQVSSSTTSSVSILQLRFPPGLHLLVFSIGHHFKTLFGQISFVILSCPTTRVRFFLSLQLCHCQYARLLINTFCFHFSCNTARLRRYNNSVLLITHTFAPCSITHSIIDF